MLDYTIPAFRSAIAIGIAFEDVIATVEELPAKTSFLTAGSPVREDFLPVLIDCGIV